MASTPQRAMRNVDAFTAILHSGFQIFSSNRVDLSEDSAVLVSSGLGTLLQNEDHGAWTARIAFFCLPSASFPTDPAIC
jgi:hypothetical protein